MPVKVWEEKLVIPTYEVGKENVNPDLLQEGNSRVYPYVRNLHLTEKKKNVTYKALYLENEYLKVCVLPEKGGRIYSAIDKVSGREMFYKGPSIKPGLIQLYGAWIANGLEFNFPMGHNITSFKNVDYYYSKYGPDADGASIVVGNIDLATRMRWSVHIALHGGKRYIELFVKLHSRTYLPERYYFWANSAVDATDGLRSILPSSHVESGGELKPFPIAKDGTDISKWKNWPHAVDLFVIDCKEDFFGCYNDDYDFGFSHYSNKFEEYGKKFFTWGNDEAGDRWRRFLSDGNTPYAEYQCGPLRTQGYFQILNPYGHNSWFEYWMPVTRTKGFVLANKELTLNFKLNNGVAHVYLNVTGKIKDASIIIKVNGEKAGQKKAVLFPEKPYYETFLLKKVADDDKVAIEIYSGDKEIGRYEREAAKIGTYESEDPVKEEYKDVYQKIYLAGIELEKQRLYRDARRKYMEVLDKDPKYIPAILRLGVLALIRGQFDNALDRFKEVREKDPRNLDACYYLGLTYKFLGNNEKARENLWKLNLHDGPLQLPAFVEIGKIDMAEGNYEEAARAMKKAYVKNADSVKVSGLYCAALRRAGHMLDAKKIANDFAVWDPVDGLVRNEDRIVNKSRMSATVLKRIIKRDKENALEISMDYISSGLYEEGIEILKKGVSAFPDYPLNYYHLGHCYEKLGKIKEAKAQYLKGARIKGERVFPWQLESYLILKHAAEEFVPKLPNTHEYLGNFLFYKMRYGEGLEKFELAKKLGSKSSVVFRNIALGHLRHKRNVEKMTRAYVEAVKKFPKEWELYYEADYILTSYGRIKERKEMYQAVNSAGAGNVFEHPKALERKVKLLVDLEKYDAAAKIMEEKNFYPWEGEVVARRVYEELYNSKAEKLIKEKKYEEAVKNIELAMQYPDNIGVGKSKTRVHYRSLFLMGIIQKERKEYGGSGKYWNDIIKTEVDTSLMTRFQIYWYFSFENFFYHILVLAENGRTTKAAKIISRLLKLCRSDYISLVNIVEYLAAYGLVENSAKVTVKDRMVSGHSIPAQIKAFLKEVAKLANKKRQTIK